MVLSRLPTVAVLLYADGNRLRSCASGQRGAPWQRKSASSLVIITAKKKTPSRHDSWLTWKQLARMCGWTRKASRRAVSCRKSRKGWPDAKWLVLVMTPAALTSEWVQDEVNAALHQVRGKRMLGVIPFVMTVCDEGLIPALWAHLHRYDATTGYEAVRDGLFAALGLSRSAKPDTPPPLELDFVHFLEEEHGMRLVGTKIAGSQPSILPRRRLMPCTAPIISMLEPFRCLFTAQPGRRC